jgi:hypothetical protein
MNDYERLKSLYATYHETAKRLVEEAKQHDELCWECPMCGGEGTVVQCSETKPLATGDLECAGIQLYGIGAGVADIQELLKGLLALAPKMFEAIDAK